MVREDNTKMANRVTAVIIPIGFDRKLSDVILPNGVSSIKDALLSELAKDTAAHKNVHKLSVPDEHECSMPFATTVARTVDATLAYLVHYGEPDKFGMLPNPQASTITGHGDLRGPILLFRAKPMDSGDDDDDNNDQTNDKPLLVNLTVVVMEVFLNRKIAPTRADPKVAASKAGNDSSAATAAAAALGVPEKNVIHVGPHLVYHGADGSAVTCDKCDASAIYPITAPGVYLCADHQPRHQSHQVHNGPPDGRVRDTFRPWNPERRNPRD